MIDEIPYNPLEKLNLGISVAEALLARSACRLDQLEAFTGAGVYAIYYQGDFRAYERLAKVNREQGPSIPIYVGKAIPEGGRKGGGFSTKVGAAKPSKALFKRLSEHAESISATKLSVADFTCRYLVVDDIWIPLGESLLIARYSPLWNLLLDGFGNHDPGNGRYNGLVPKWDVLHPGRTWASKCKPRAESAHQIAEEVVSWLSQAPALAQSRYSVQQAVAEYRVILDGGSELTDASDP